MHPVIRIVTCLSLIGVIVSSAQTLLWVCTILLLAAVLLLNKLECLRSTLLIAWRLKWLFLSIMVFYLWWTPGEPVLVTRNGLAQFIPSQQGFTLGLHRIAVLGLIILSVQFLVAGMNQNSLLQAINWLLHPVKKSGISTDTFSVRCVLTIEALQQLRAAVTDALGQVSEKGRLNRAIAVLTDVYQFASRRESTDTHDVITIELLSAPPVLQWGIPVLILIAPLLARLQGW